MSFTTCCNIPNNNADDDSSNHPFNNLDIFPSTHLLIRVTVQMKEVVTLHLSQKLHLNVVLLSQLRKSLMRTCKLLLQDDTLHGSTLVPWVCNLPGCPDNIYGTGHPGDIKREIEREQKWTCQVLQEGTPRLTCPLAELEHNEPMPEEQPFSPLPPLTPSLPPEPTMSNIDNLYEGEMDIDSLMECGYLISQSHYGKGDG